MSFVLLGVCYYGSTDGIPRKGMELSKAVTEPMKQFVPRSAIRGFQDDFSGRKEEVLLLSGPWQPSSETSRSLLNMRQSYILESDRVYRVVCALQLDLH